MNQDHSQIHLAKKAAGEAAAKLVENDMTIGLGTGSTAWFFIEALSRRCHEGLKIQAVASSEQSMQQAMAAGIPLIDNQKMRSLDLTVDGADEIDINKNMIKGGGGALLREKILASSSQEMVVIVDENKLVKQLGAFPVPVEIASFGYRSTLDRLENQGYQGRIRLNKDNSIYLTDNGNYIADIRFQHSILNPQAEHVKLMEITGVLATGLFFGIAGRVIVGYPNGKVDIR